MFINKHKPCSQQGGRHKPCSQQGGRHGRLLYTLSVGPSLNTHTVWGNFTNPSQLTYDILICFNLEDMCTGAALFQETKVFGNQVLTVFRFEKLVKLSPPSHLHTVPKNNPNLRKTTEPVKAGPESLKPDKLSQCIGSRRDRLGFYAKNEIFLGQCKNSSTVNIYG